MSPAKTVKKSLSFSTDEHDQRLLEYANQALESEQFASFNELAKAALQALFAADVPDPLAATADAPTAGDASRDEETLQRLEAIESQIQHLVTAQSELASTVQGQQKTLQQQNETLGAEFAKLHARAETEDARSGERVVKLEETLISLQTTQQELLNTVQHDVQQQTEKLLAELRSVRPTAAAEASAPVNATTNGGSMPPTGDGLSHLARYLEEF